MAHAGYYMEDMEKFYELLDSGFDGVEIYHPNHSNGTVNTLREITGQRELLVSGGSDFHGFAERDAVGEPRVSYELFEKIKSGLDAAAGRRGT